MNFHYTPYTLLSLISTFISLAFVAFAWRRRSAAGVLPFIVVLLSVAVWSFGYALELASADVPTVMFWVKLQYFGIATAPIAWMLTALEYAGRDQWTMRRRVLLLAIIPATTILLALTNEYHHLIWSSISIDTGGPFTVFQASYGFWFWVHTANSYIGNAVATVVLLQSYYRVPMLYRKQALALLVCALMPWVGNVLYLTGTSPIPHLDLTPFTFVLSGTAVAFGVLRFQLLDIGPVAYELVVESMSDGVVVLDQRNRVVSINPVAQELLGVTAAQVYGKLLGQFLLEHVDVVDRYRAVLHAREEIMIENRGEQRYFDLQISPIYSQTASMSGRLIVWRDISERKQIEAEQLQQKHMLEALAVELRSAKESAEAASRAKSAFLAHMSHELRTPLSAMLGYNELLQRQLQNLDQPQLVADTERVDAAGTHLLNLINTVLDFSKVEANKMVLQQHVIEIDLFIDDVTSAFQPLVQQRGNRLVTSYALDSRTMCTDVEKLRQILLNLLSNANKFTDGGTITLDVREEHPPQHEGNGHAAHRTVLFCVSDTGIGIQPEHVQQLFQEFTQVADTSQRFYGGTGLGLALSQRLCQLMGGEISVASTYGHGSTFTVWLPDLAPGQTDESQPSAALVLAARAQE